MKEVRLKRFAAWQKQFGQAITTPFDFSTGKFVYQNDAYPQECVNGIVGDEVLSPLSRLNAYNGQYWFRLLSVLQDDFPLLSRRMGLWDFNRLATAFLVANPPKPEGIQKIADRMTPFLRSGGGEECGAGAWTLPLAQLDDAYRTVFMAKHQDPLDPNGGAAWEDAGLVFADSCVLYSQTLAWVEMRRELDLEVETPLADPPSSFRHWAIFRAQGSIHTLELDSDRWQAMAGLRAGLGVNAALERAFELSAEPEHFESKISQWFEEGMKWGWWSSWRTPVESTGKQVLGQEV